MRIRKRPPLLPFSSSPSQNPDPCLQLEPPNGRGTKFEKVEEKGGREPRLHPDGDLLVEAQYERRKYPAPSNPHPKSTHSKVVKEGDAQVDSSNRSTALPDLVSVVHPVQQKGAGQRATRKRVGDFHQIIFGENGLPDGAELSYISKGQKVLIGYKKGHGILCRCCNEVISPSKFEAHAGYSAKCQPYRHIYTSDGISLHALTNSLSRKSKRNQNLISICKISVVGES